jgi:hypothetical protein
MNIPNKYIWIKFIPIIGILFCIIDTSNDGNYWERAYIYYHVVISALLFSFI